MLGCIKNMFSISVHYFVHIFQQIFHLFQQISPLNPPFHARSNDIVLQHSMCTQKDTEILNMFHLMSSRAHGQLTGSTDAISERLRWEPGFSEELTEYLEH